MRADGAGGWQDALLAGLRGREEVAVVEPYGSVVSGGRVDGWSDLDVRLRLDRDLDAEALLGGPLWAWQETSIAAEQVLRLVVEDGRRVDARITGARVVLPEPPADGGVRFDAALAACAIGRGKDLVGLHLLLGVLREALVQGMLLADRDAGSSAHRSGGQRDRLARDAARVAGAPLSPGSAVEAYALYGTWRHEVDGDYAPDPAGLLAVVQRGTAPS